MFFPVRMLRLQINIEPDHSDDVLLSIGREGILHIHKRESSLNNAAEASRLDILLRNVQKYMLQLGIKSKKYDIPLGSNFNIQLNELENSLSSFGNKIDDNALKLEKIKQEKRLFDQAFSVKAALASEIDINRLLDGLSYIQIRVGIAGFEETELLRLSIKTKDNLLIDQPLYDKTNAVVLLYEKEDEDEVVKALNTLKVNELSVKYFSDKAFQVHKSEEEKYLLEFDTLREKYKAQLQRFESHLLDLQALESAKSSLIQDRNGMILEGWIPENEADKFEQSLEHATVIYLDDEGEAPVLLNTPQPFKTFEKLISGFSCPQYGEMSPVVPFALSFLLLFAIMFGDVGHGLVLMIFGLLIKRYKEDYAYLGQIYYLSGIASTIFGFLYGSVFGIHDLFPHLLFNPIENIEKTIMLSIGLGIVIISFSFLLNLITVVKHKKPKMLFSGEGSLLWLLVYWFTIGIAVKSMIQNLDITYEMIVLSLFLLIIFIQMLIKRTQKFHAVIDLFREFMDIITNTLSFLRVGAFTLAHSALFMAVFSIAKMISEIHGKYFCYWLLIIFGNVVIIVLEGVIVTIQTLRLEYYEFFKRFFKGGGTPYTPYQLGEKNEN